MLRSWLAGAGPRTVAARAGADRKTARRHVEAAVAAGLPRDGGTGHDPAAEGHHDTGAPGTTGSL